MPLSRLPDRHYLSNVLPPLEHRQSFGWDWDSVVPASSSAKNSHTPGSHRPEEGEADFSGRHGLQTPPRDMNGMSGMNGNPLLAPDAENIHYNRVPVVASNAPPYQAFNSTLSNEKQAGNRQPFYNTYYSARRPSSPPPKKDNPISNEHSARRQASSDSNSIASHLQIPASINDSKGSLPEFAAQITCFFWFESSFTIYSIEDTAFPSSSTVNPLVSEAMPTTGFRKWVTTILSMTQVSQNVILLALMFIYRLKRLNPGVKGKIGSEFRLLTVALMLGNKFLDDNTYTNKTWADVSGISVQEIHVMEVEFLSNMRYTLFTSEAEWNAWHVKLGKFSDYYDEASRARLENPPRTVPLATPAFGVAPNLPSPPVSQHTSPPFKTNSSPSNPKLSHPPSVAPYLAPNIPSPVTPMPEVDLKPWPRKRSLEDHSSEPPAKRLSSLNPSAASSTIVTPSTVKNSIATAPRLPMPNLSISTNTQHSGYATTAQMPMPSGRAMSAVFPGPNRWPQNGMLPSLQPSTYLSHPGSVRGSPMPEQPIRQTPYGSGSATPSPTSFHFPPGQHTPNGLSPSGFAAPRNSPYKPIRGVNTLLVPPPSASVHQNPQNLSYDQMHYQPLGKPISEQRRGVLPYLPLDTWSQSHQAQQNYLPQPNYAS